jgi:uncharacterized protein YukE
VPAGFEVDPDRLDEMAVRFRQTSDDLNDLRSLASFAAAVDLQGTPSGETFALAWGRFERAYDDLAKSAAAIAAKLNQNALKYRDTDRSTKFDGTRLNRNRD